MLAPSNGFAMRWAVRVLRSFDLLLGPEAQRPVWLHLKPPTPFEIVAADGGGGVFVAYGSGPVEQRPVLYASSDGQAGRIAGDYRSFLALILALPCWKDVLKFSGAGDLEEMRRYARLDTGPGHFRRLKRTMTRCLLSRILHLRLPVDPVGDLRREVTMTDVQAVGEDGTPGGSLFGDFVCHVDEHRVYRVRPRQA